MLFRSHSLTVTLCDHCDSSLYGRSRIPAIYGISVPPHATPVGGSGLEVLDLEREADERLLLGLPRPVIQLRTDINVHVPYPCEELRYTVTATDHGWN